MFLPGNNKEPRSTVVVGHSPRSWLCVCVVERSPRSGETEENLPRTLDAAAYPAKWLKACPELNLLATIQVERKGNGDVGGRSGNIDRP